MPFAGKTLPQSSSIFRLIASLDLVLMINPLIASGILLFKKNRQGNMYWFNYRGPSIFVLNYTMFKFCIDFH